jgi:Na+-translocating ferredoxin:NAD+ oxidoreductase subunit B
MGSEHYERLREFLDEIRATGFPKTPSRVEIRILERLFAPEEAEAAVYLKTMPEPVEVIAGRMGKDPTIVSRLLKEMAEHCLIRAIPAGSEENYADMPFAPGILELSVRRADAEYARDYLAYLDEGFGASLVTAGKFSIARTLPIEESIAAGHRVVPYEQISEIITKAARPRAVTECWCRKIKATAGKPCDKPLESCISFGPFAQDFIDTKMGREIDDTEFMTIMSLAKDAGLVHIIALNTSSFEDVLNICNCCSCCCGVLTSIQNI